MFFLSILISLTQVFAAVPTNCEVAQEFIASLEYLREKKIMTEPQARETAFIVASGCTFAARRLIRVYETLETAGQSSKENIKTALDYAKKSDQEADAFIHIFRTAFLSDELDLDFTSSMKMANELSASFSGNIAGSRDDFDAIFKHCKTKWSKPARECAGLATRLAKRGESLGGGIAQGFLKFVDFLRTKDGGALSIVDSLNQAEETASLGFAATVNYMQTYKYAISKEGLNLSHQDAVNTAKKLSLLTNKP